MNDLTPRQPKRPLFWPDILLDIQEMLPDTPVYIVGGAVRDAYLHRPVHDLDLVTTSNAVQLARQIANHFKGDVFVLDAERDVGRALIDTPEGRLCIDVAGLRGGDLLADLQDRDFTLNAMAVDLHGNTDLLIDPLNGEGDILVKLIRRCSLAAIPHDPIRGMRAVRQAAQLNYRIEPETMRDIRAHATALRETSPERVRDELFKILSVSKPSGALRIADSLGLLKVILPEIEALHGYKAVASDAFDVWTHSLTVLEKLNTIITGISPARTDNTLASFEMGMLMMQFDPYRKELLEHFNAEWPNDRTHRSLLMLTALLHDIGKPFFSGDHRSSSFTIAGEHADNLRLSNGEKQRLTTAIQHHHHPALTQEEVTPLVAHRFWYKFGKTGVDIILLSLADYLGTELVLPDQREWLERVERARRLLDAFYKRHDEIVSPPVLVDGNELQQQLNLKPGPKIGQLLTVIREAQVTGEVNTVEDALQLAREHL